jgi:hypothetical protein
MRDEYINAALDRLTELVDSGVSLPTAHESVASNFELTAHEAHILLSRYDTMLYNLDKVIARRPTSFNRYAGHGASIA